MRDTNKEQNAQINRTLCGFFECTPYVQDRRFTLNAIIVVVDDGDDDDGSVSVCITRRNQLKTLRGGLIPFD